MDEPLCETVRGVFIILFTIFGTIYSIATATSRNRVVYPQLEDARKLREEKQRLFRRAQEGSLSFSAVSRGALSVSDSCGALSEVKK